MTEILPHLTPKEEQVAALVAQGFTNKQIASELGVVMNRVRVLIAAVAYKVHANPAGNDRVQVALWWDRTHNVVNHHSA